MLRQEQSTHMRELIIAEWPDIESGSADMLGKKKMERKQKKRTDREGTHHLEAPSAINDEGPP